MAAPERRTPGPQPAASARLRQRRLALQQRSTELRERLARHSVALEPAFDAAQSARDGWRWLRERPWVPAGVALLLVWRRPRAVWRGALLVWRGWRVWQRYGPLVQRGAGLFARAAARR